MTAFDQMSGLICRLRPNGRYSFLILPPGKFRTPVRHADDNAAVPSPCCRNRACCTNVAAVHAACLVLPFLRRPLVVAE